MKNTIRPLATAMAILLALAMILVPVCVSAEDETTAEVDTTAETVVETEADTTVETVVETEAGTDATVAEDLTTAAPTEAVTEGSKLEKANIINWWDTDEKTLKRFTSAPNQTTVTYSEEGMVFTWNKPNDGGNADPYVTFSITNYYKAAKETAPEPADANFVVFKVKATNCNGNFELFTATPAGGDSVTTSYQSNGEWEYIIVDMSATTLVSTKKLTTMRIDWASGAADENAEMKMIIGEIGFFANEEDAQAYAGIDTSVTEAPATTAAPVATKAETAAPTEAATTAAAEEKKGCSSVVATSAGVAALVMAMSAAVALKRKNH